MRWEATGEASVPVAFQSKLERGLTAAAAATEGLIEYIPFPDALRGKYQCYTQADLTALRDAGCDHAFADVQTGVAKYMAALATQD